MAKLEQMRRQWGGLHFAADGTQSRPEFGDRTTTPWDRWDISPWAAVAYWSPTWEPGRPTPNTPGQAGLTRKEFVMIVANAVAHPVTEVRGCPCCGYTGYEDWAQWWPRRRMAPTTRTPPDVKWPPQCLIASWPHGPEAGRKLWSAGSELPGPCKNHYEQGFVDTGCLACELSLPRLHLEMLEHAAVDDVNMEPELAHLYTDTGGPIPAPPRAVDAATLWCNRARLTCFIHNTRDCPACRKMSVEVWGTPARPYHPLVSPAGRKRSRQDAHAADKAARALHITPSRGCVQHQVGWPPRACVECTVAQGKLRPSTLTKKRKRMSGR